MMILKVAVAIALSQYVRSRVTDGDPKSPCLYWTEGTRLVYRQSEAGNPETPGETEFSAVRKAFDTWQAEQARCGSLTLAEGPRTSSRRAGYEPTSASNENVVLFRQRTCAGLVPAGDACLSDDNCGSVYDCWQYAPAAIAITTTSFNTRSGQILDSDIELNTPRFLFTTVDEPPCPMNQFDVSCVATDVQNTMTHEIGHLLGLAHTAEDGSTMAARANGGETSKRTLDSNSAKFICDVYPAGRPSKSCVVPVLGQETLSPSTGGCASAPGGALAALALVLLRRRARR
jgi:hypothetical protein